MKKKVPRDSITFFDQLIGGVHHAERTKNDKRVRQFKNYDFKAMRVSAKSKEKCSRCRTRKSKKKRNSGKSRGALLKEQFAGT